MKKINFTLKTIFSCLIVVVVSQQNISAQGVEREGKTTANASQVYLEAGGSGILYSVNYDGRFKKEENGFGFRIGIGGAGNSGTGYIAIPAQVNYLAGSKGQYLEVGGGITYVSASISDIFDDSGASDNTVAASFVLGFRKQPFGKKGITWRIAFTPFIAEGGFYPSGGASIGFRF